MGRNSSDHVILYAAKGDNALVNAAGAVALFDYGLYDSLTLANNDTNDQYISIAISYFNAADTMSVDVTLNVVAGFSGTTINNSNTAPLTGKMEMHGDR